jgi:flagellar hook-basal body complex protein FliE
MAGIDAIGATALTSDPLISRLGLPQTPDSGEATQSSFGTLLADGMEHVEAKVAHANDLVRQFALDDSIPLHQVTYALEEARIAVELAMQIRTRLVESYRELMNMQL